MVKPEQDCLKWNGGRNSGEKGREGMDKEPSPGFGNINFGVSESSNVPVGHIREYFRYFMSIYPVFVEIIYPIFTARMHFRKTISTSHFQMCKESRQYLATPG